MTYAEYLKSQGASEEDIKLLDHPLARKAYTESQDKLAAAEAARTAAVTDVQNFQKWHDDIANPAYIKMQNELIAAKGNEARAAAALKAAQEQGLIEVAANAGYVTEPPAANGAPAGFDPSKFVTQERLQEVAAIEGDAIALAQDIAYEHRILFPDKTINFRELRKEAMAARKPVEQFWQEKYGVIAARQARLDADKSAYETRLRKEGADAKALELASQYGNPETRPLAVSRSPLIPRTEGPRTGKQPWDTSVDLSSDRVQRVTQSILSKQLN